MWSKKKFVALFAMVMIALLSMNVFATEGTGELLTANSTGYTNVAFSNGYHGFCIDRDKAGAYSNDGYIVADMTDAKSNIDGSDISQKLKLLFVLNFDSMFISDGNGGYELDPEKRDGAVAGSIYHFSEDQYAWGEQLTYCNAIKAYNGPAIPDSGHQITLANGDKITFDFMTIAPYGKDKNGTSSEGRQYFFAYKISVQKAGDTNVHEHTPSSTLTQGETEHWYECESDDCEEKLNVEYHDFGTTWSKNTTNHWKECECGAKKEETAHTFEDKKNETHHWEECECGQVQNKVEHTYSEEHSKDKTNHWFECECGAKSEETAHTFEDKKNETHHWEECECGQVQNKEEHTYSEEYSKDDENHWFECTCGAKKDETAHTFEDKKNETHHWEECECGQVQNKVEHTYSEEYSKDEENHWFECTCGAKTEEGTHEGTVADCVTVSVCETCEKELEGANQENHTGNIEIRNQKDATETEEGYTGDTHCKDCDELLEEGTVIPARHSHAFTLQKNDKGHFEECACGTKSEVEEHEFEDNKCSVCGYTRTVETTPTETESSETPMGDKDYKVWVAVCAISIIAMIALDKKRRSLNK